MFYYKQLRNSASTYFYSHIDEVLTTFEFFSLVEDILVNNPHLNESEINVLFQKRVREVINKEIKEMFKMVEPQDYVIITDYLFVEPYVDRPLFYDVMKIGFIWGIAFMSSKAENKFKLMHPDQYYIAESSPSKEMANCGEDYFSRYAIQKYLYDYRVGEEYNDF